MHRWRGRCSLGILGCQRGVSKRDKEGGDQKDGTYERRKAVKEVDNQLHVGEVFRSVMGQQK